MAQQKLDIPPIFTELWDNWRQDDGGKGRCRGCPAHWSVRTDFPGEPYERNSSFQHRPLFGEGSLEADIAIIAREPGKPQEFRRGENRRKQSFESVRHDSIHVGGTIKFARAMIDQFEASNFEVYYTQLRKCNEIDGSGNEAARKQCCGLGEHQGYLRDELEAVHPDYVVTLGVPGFKKIQKIFDVEDLGPGNPTEEFAKGEFESGLRVLESKDPDFSFSVLPAPHPDPRGARQVYKLLDINVDTRKYFELFGRDVLRYIKQNSGK